MDPMQLLAQIMAAAQGGAPMPGAAPGTMPVSMSPMREIVPPAQNAGRSRLSSDRGYMEPAVNAGRSRHRGYVESEEYDPEYSGASDDTTVTEASDGDPREQTERELDTVSNAMGKRTGYDPAMDTQGWAPADEQELPPTVDEFRRRYGRDPATDSEMEFYYGDEEDPDNSEDFR